MTCTQPNEDETNNNCGNNQKALKQGQENYECQVSDTQEVKELKNRMKVIMNKLNTSKKEKEQIQKENKQLQEEIMLLQSNLRQMISGFSNTSSAFPMMNELVIQIQDFTKYDCVDIFFDVLCPELNIKGILFFYTTSFYRLNECITNYLQPVQNSIKKTGCLDSIEGPIMNVLRKSYQINYKEMIKKCLNKENINKISDEIQNNLKLGALSPEIYQTIVNFITKLGELLFCFNISDPPLHFDPKSIGQKVIYNSLKHDPFDGFIKNKEECIIIIPSINKQNSENELVVKALVLQTNYEIPN